MEDLIIKGSKITPEITFKIQENEFSISGTSLPEDSREFYNVVFDWVNAFAEESPRSFSLKVQLEYFNSSSSKQILKLFYLLEDLVDDNGFEIKVLWRHKASDTLILEKGEEFKDMIDIPLEIEAI